MTEKREDDFERWLVEEFSRACQSAAPDEGFTEGVLRRLRRRARVRATILGLAVVAGVAVAASPVLQIAGILSDLAPLLTDEVALGELSAQYRYVAMAALLGLASPLLIRLLER